MQINDIVNCKVIDVHPLGASIEFIDEQSNICKGMISVLDATWSIIRKSNDIFKVGQELKGFIKNIIFDEDDYDYFYFISLKIPELNPWLKVNYEVGNIITGKVIWIQEKVYKNKVYYIEFAEIEKDIHVLFETDNEVELSEQVTLKITDVDIKNETLRGEITHG